MTECNYAYRFADIHDCVFLLAGFFGILLFQDQKTSCRKRTKKSGKEVVTHYGWNRLRMSDLSSTRNVYPACPVESESDAAK